MAIGIEHVNDYTLIKLEIRFVAADLIRDSIRTKISDLQVPITNTVSCWYPVLHPYLVPPLVTPLTQTVPVPKPGYIRLWNSFCAGNGAL